MATVTEPAGRATDRSGYLRETLAILWPEPARIERRGRAAPGTGARPGRAAAGGGRTEFLLVPNETRPVLLVPRRPRRAAAAALRHYKASAVGPPAAAVPRPGPGRRSSAWPTCCRTGSRSGRPGTGPTRTWPPTCARSLDRDLVVSLRIGPPRANRKPVLELLSPDGEMLGFAKVGITDLTRELVRTEAAALDVLGVGRADPPAGAPAAAPRPVARARGPGPGAAESAPAGPVSRAMLTSAMAELATRAGRHHAAGRPEPLLARAAVAAGGLRASRAGRGAAAGHGRPAGHRRRATSLAFGSWHGDWTPWNMAALRRPGARLGLGTVRERRARRLRRPALPAAGGGGAATVPEEHRPPPRRRCSPPR